MIKKIGLSVMIALLPAVLCSMDDNKRVGKILADISEDSLEVLTHDPMPGDTVIYRYNHEYYWAQVKQKGDTEWQITIKLDDSKAYGLLVKFERLYKFMQDDKK